MRNVKKAILALSTLAICCVTCGGLTAVNANAAELEQVNNTVDTVSFQIVSGAAIRLDSNAQDGKDENGIRYQITMPDSEYKALERNAAYASVSYGILIAPNDYVTKYGALDKENVFGNDAAYDWAVKNEDGEWVYNGSKTRIMNFETDTLSPWSKDETVRTYFGSIVNLDETNIPRSFVGVGYMKYTMANGDTDYVFAAANDNVRSMSQVARSAYADTSANALPQSTKDTLKKTYIDDVYGKTFDFNKTTDTYYVSSYDGNVSIEDDAQCEDGKAVQAKFMNGAVNDLVIDVGGEYQFKDIEKIEITYKITGATKESDSWWRLFLNDNVAEGKQVVKGTGVTFTDETGRGGGTMTSFATMTIKPAEANAKTGLSEEDYFTKIHFGYRYSAEYYSAHGATILIDSIRIVEKENYLEFNSEDAIDAVVIEGYNTSIVDLGNGNKALQADLCQWYSGGTRGNLKINLGGQYQVKDVAKVEISYKVFAVTASSSAMYWNIHLNASGSYTSVDYNNRLTGIGATTFVATSGFNTITLTDAGAAASSLTGNTIDGTLLNQDSYLENLFFCVNGSGDTSIATIQIDYIRITLK